MQLAIVQMDAAYPGNKLERLETAARQAAKAGAKILVTPELATTGYGAGPDLAHLAESEDGPTITALAILSRELDLAIVVGLALRRGEAIINAAVFLCPDGSKTIHVKCHLYGDYEKQIFAPGDGTPVLHTYLGLTFGLLVCFDVEFPERVRALALAGANVILVPTALPYGESATFVATRMVPVRAFENQVFIAYADHSGADTRFHYAGSSCIVSPKGDDLARAAETGEIMLMAEINPAHYTQSRRDNAYLAELLLHQSKVVGEVG